TDGVVVAPRLSGRRTTGATPGADLVADQVDRDCLPVVRVRGVLLVSQCHGKQAAQHALHADVATLPRWNVKLEKLGELLAMLLMRAQCVPALFEEQDVDIADQVKVLTTEEIEPEGEVLAHSVGPEVGPAQRAELRVGEGVEEVVGKTRLG